VVVLVCKEHEDDAQFKREVLADPELVRCVKEREMLVWGADVRTREGYQGGWDYFHSLRPDGLAASLFLSCRTIPGSVITLNG
jgi:hypothetical protein